MGVINFCGECGELRVRQVKGQLEKLFADKTPPKHNKCLFCQSQLKTSEVCKKEPDDGTGDRNVVKPRNKRYNFRRISSSEDENESVDIHFDLVNTSDYKDSESTSSSSNKKGIVIKTEKQNTKQSLPEKRKLTIVTLKRSKSEKRTFTKTKKKLKILEEEKEKDKKVNKKGKDEEKEKVTVKNGEQIKGAKLRKRPRRVKVKYDRNLAKDKEENDQDLIKTDKEKVNDQKPEEKTEKKKKGPETISDGEYERRLSLDERILDMVDKSVTGPKTKAMKCKECSVSFCHIQKFIAHINTHLDEKLDIPCPFVCPVCSRREKTFMALDYHMIAHRKERPYSCDWPGCTWKFTCQKYLRKHIERHKGNKSYTARYKQLKKFKCSRCDYAATSRKVLEFHENTHTNARPFKCDFCDRRFNNSRNKQIHQRVVHSDGMDNHVMCDLCGAFFKGDLKKHKRIHTGEKPYTCEHCGYRSNRADNLRKHLRVHEGKNKHKCSDCDMTFYSKEACKNHEVAVHTSKIPPEVAMHISKKAMYSEIAIKESNDPLKGNISSGSDSSLAEKPTTKIYPILLAQNDDHGVVFHGPTSPETSNRVLPVNPQSIDPNRVSTGIEKDSPDRSTPHHAHLSNFPMLINHPQIESSDRQYDHSARSEAHEPQLRSQRTPVSETESLERPLQDQQEASQSRATQARLQTVEFGGHGLPVRLPEGDDGSQRISLIRQDGSVESASHGTPLRLQEGHITGHGPPLRPNQGIQIQGHGVPLRPNQAPLPGQGPGTPLRPVQGPFPNERSQSEWITAINLLQHLNQM